jgi:hypothetical protein
MKLPLIQGLIDRRILANYRVDPDALAPLLPAPFRPKLIGGHGIAGICLIRLREIRPRGLPKFLGISSENTAHRIAVEWTDENGHSREGVYIPRRDTSSRLNVIAGGRLFTGVHHHAHFDVRETENHFHVALESDDHQTHVSIDAHLASDLPETSIFKNLPAASDFFEGGSLGYSPSASGQTLDALELQSIDWKVEPLAVDRFESSFFDDRARFPTGSLQFDCALLMRHMRHEWHEREPMCVGCEPVGA